MICPEKIIAATGLIYDVNQILFFTAAIYPTNHLNHQVKPLGMLDCAASSDIGFRYAWSHASAQSLQMG